MTSGIENLRAEIDEVDSQILELLGRRFKLAVSIAEVKKEVGQSPRDDRRELQVLNRAAETAGNQGFNPVFAMIIYNLIMTESHRMYGGAAETPDPVES